MKKYSIALVGSSGYIANHIVGAYKNAHHIKNILRFDKIGVVDYRLDLENLDNFDFSVLSNVDFVIFTAAISGPDKCATDFDFCWKINVKGTNAFIKKAIENKCKVIFFSSDAVFSGSSQLINDENSETVASTAYGKMKKAVEDEFLNCPYFKAIRLSYVVSANDRFTSQCLKSINANETLEVFHPFYRNAIVISDVIKVIDWLINHWDNYEPPFLNVAGVELVSRVRIADEINRINGNTAMLKYKVVNPDDDFFKNRPRLTQMRSEYLYKLGILKEESFSEKIYKEFKAIKESNNE